VAKWRRDLDEIEMALRTELRKPIEPPDGFAERVLAKATGIRPVRVWAHRAIAAALLAAAVLGVSDGVRFAETSMRDRARLETQREARQQFLLAMRITDATLQTAVARGLKDQLGVASEKVREAQQ
jgi:hypothetical protein